MAQNRVIRSTHGRLSGQLLQAPSRSAFQARPLEECPEPALRGMNVIAPVPRHVEPDGAQKKRRFEEDEPRLDPKPSPESGPRACGQGERQPAPQPLFFKCGVHHAEPGALQRSQQAGHLQEYAERRVVRSCESEKKHGYLVKVRGDLALTNEGRASPVLSRRRGGRNVIQARRQFWSAESLPSYHRTVFLNMKDGKLRVAASGSNNEIAAFELRSSLLTAFS